MSNGDRGREESRNGKGRGRVVRTDLLIGCSLSFLYERLHRLAPVDGSIDVHVADETPSNPVHVVLGKGREQLKRENKARKATRELASSSHDGLSSTSPSPLLLSLLAVEAVYAEEEEDERERRLTISTFPPLTTNTGLVPFSSSLLPPSLPDGGYLSSPSLSSFRLPHLQLRIGYRLLVGMSCVGNGGEGGRKKEEGRGERRGEERVKVGRGVEWPVSLLPSRFCCR